MNGDDAAAEPLVRLVRAYQAKVRAAVDLFARHKGMSPPATPVEWIGAIPQTGTLDPAGTIRYFLHGYGCAVAWPDGTGVDWDFGQSGEIDGFDPGRLFAFARASGAPHPEFPDRDSVKRAVSEAVAAGRVRSSGHDDGLYFLTDGAQTR